LQPIHNGGVTTPKGFLAAGIFCGIKKSKKKDLALISSEKIASAAGVFTKNTVKAAPVVLDMGLIKMGLAQNIIINSGNANCSTGALGLKNAQIMAEATGPLTLVASTGVIGVQLPIDVIKTGIKKLKNVLSKSGGRSAAEAILTTDTFKKEIAVKIKINGRDIYIGAMAKGSGMIHPDMATMISVITTDANISPTALKKALSAAVQNSFNMISVDGDMSTNDCVFILANGMSGSKEIKEKSKEFKLFLQALDYICKYLAKEIVKDGEGATKIFEVNVIGAKNDAEAKILARAVTNSNLVRTAIYGSDPNWGRIMAALGSTGIKFDPDLVEVTMDNLKSKVVLIKINLNSGSFNAIAWGCDLTEGYIKINARYHT